MLGGLAMPRHHHDRHTRGPRHLAGPGRASRSGRHLQPRRPAPASMPKRAMLLLTCAVALVGLLVSLPGATATTVTSRFSPSADAYVSQTRPTANFGSAKELLAGSRPKLRRSYLRFEVVNLSGTVAKATVRFYSNDANQAGFEVRAVTDSTWDEQTITYKTAPPPGPVVATAPQVPADAFTNPVTYRVSGTPTVITAAAGQDSVVRFAGPVNKRLILQGGRNWVIVGGEINIDRPWEKSDDRNAILVKDATGVVHIEGVFMHGIYINDGIKACAPDAVFQIENNRIVNLLGTQAGYHADVIQPYCGFKELRVDGLTGYSQFQGLMFKADGGSWRTTTLKRINLVGIAPQDGYPINVVTGCCNNDGNSYVTGPISLSDVYISPSVSHNSGTLSGNICPAATFTFKTDTATGREYAEHRTDVSPQIMGRIWKGGPPLGDYVPDGVTGVGYVAPPYL